MKSKRYQHLAASLKKAMVLLLALSICLSAYVLPDHVHAAEAGYEPAGTVAHYPLNAAYQYKNKLNESQALSGNSPSWKPDYVSLVNPGNANNGHIAGANPGAAVTGAKISFSLNIKLNKTQTRSYTPAYNLLAYGAGDTNNITLRPYYADGLAAVVLKQGGADAVVASFPAPAADMWHNYTISLDGTAGSGKLIVWVDGIKAAEASSNGIGADQIGNGQFRLNRMMTSGGNPNLDAHYRDVRVMNNAVDQAVAQALTDEMDSFIWNELLSLQALTLSDGAMVRGNLFLIQDPGITWVSSDAAVIDPQTGAVTRPQGESAQDTDVMLTLNWRGHSQAYHLTVLKNDGSLDGVTVAHYPLNSTHQAKNRLNPAQALASDNASWKADYVSLVNPGNANNGHIAGTNPGTPVTGRKLSFSLDIKLNKTQTRTVSAANTLFSYGADNNTNLTLRPYYSAGMAAVVLKRNGTDAVVASFPAPAADMWHNYTISLDGTAGTGKLIVWVDGVKAAEAASNGIGADELGNGVFRLNRTISTAANLDSHYRDVRVFDDALDENAALVMANEIRSFTWNDLLASKPLTDGLVVRKDLPLLRDANIVWTSSDNHVIDPATGAVARPVKGAAAKRVTLTMNWFEGFSQAYTVTVMPIDAGDYLIADFNFNDGASGLAGGGAKAAVQGTASYADSFEGNGKAANIGSAFWLNVTKEDGTTPLLAGLEEFTVSYDSKTGGGSGWAFFAAPNTTAQTVNKERYLGILDKTDSLTVERYNNNGARPANPAAASGTEWKHVDVVVKAAATELYIDGVLQAAAASSYAVTDILTASGGILQIGKGNWGTGEYYAGLLDNFQIFDRALSQDDLTEYRVTNIPPLISPADGGQIYVPVAITHPAGNNYLYYTTDGTDPTLASAKYTGPFTVEHGKTVKAAAIAPNGNRSEIASVQYYGSEWAATANEFRLDGQSTVNNVKISWPLIAGADYYEVYRGEQLINRTYGDTVDEYNLEIGQSCTYTVKAVSGGAPIVSAQTNTVHTFSYDPAAVVRKKNNYNGADSLGAGNTYGVQSGNTWYHYVYKAVKNEATGIVTTGIYEQTGTDGRTYGNDRLLGSFEDMRVEGAGYKLHPATGKIIFTAHEEASSGYVRAAIFIASATPGGNDFAATFRGRPSNADSSLMDSRDMSLFADDDGRAYLIFATRNNSDIGILKLDAEWEQPDRIVNIAFAGKHKESPTVIKYEGRYYFFGSTANGWYPSQAEYASAESLDGEWTPLRPIGNGSTFATQANGVGAWTGSNGRIAFAENGYHWGAQYAADYKDPMGTYARLFPMAFHNGIATADWFPQLDLDPVYGLIPVQAGQYLSLGKKATDSLGLDATAVTDGADLASSPRVQHTSLPYSMVIDLEQPSRLSEINLTTRIVTGSDTVYRYTLEGSLDNGTWTQLVDGSANNVSGFVANPVTDTGRYRYVRLTVNNIINVHNGQSAVWADGIIELAVFGTPYIDKSELQAKYEARKDTAKGNYTNATWNTIVRALDHAAAVLADASATQWTVDRAALQIDEAFNWALTVQPDQVVDYASAGVPVGETWYDTEGNPIQAHGGGFLQQTAADGKPIYYWVGENKIHNRASFHAVALYSSRDLVNWVYEGDIIDPFTQAAEGAEYGLLDNKWERPKLLYNEKTKKYVLWGHWETAGSYATSQIAVATADHVAGPYTFLGHWRPGGTLRNWRSENGIYLDSDYYKTSGVKATVPAETVNDVSQLGYTSRDFTVFVDDDKTAYLVSAEGHSMRIHRLNDEYTDVDFTTYTFSDPAGKAEDFESYSFYEGVGREAPAVVRADDGYYMVSSGQSGWLPNQGTVSFNADLTAHAGWTTVKENGRIVEKYAFGNNSTYYSQPTNIMKLVNEKGEKTYVYMGDRWRSSQLSDSRYVWLPITFDEAEHTASITFTTGWKLNAATGNVQLPQAYLVSQGKSAAFVNGDGNTVAGIEKANDGIEYSLSTSGDSTHFFGGLAAPYEYTVDLGAVYDLSRMDVAYRLYNGSEMYHRYQIFGSNDNADWTELVNNSTNMWAGFNSDKLSGSYRYVKLKVNEVRRVNNNALSNGWGSGLVEVQVYANQAAPLDRTALNAAIALAQGLAETDYTADSWANLRQALEAAIPVRDNPAATDQQLAAAASALQEALAALEHNPPAAAAVTLSGPQRVAANEVFDVIFGLNTVSGSVYQSVTHSVYQTVAQGVYARDFTIHYDPLKVDYISAAPLKPGFSILEESASSGQIRFRAADAQPVQPSDPVQLLRTQFKAKELEHTVTSSVYLSNVVLADGAGREISVTDAVYFSFNITAAVPGARGDLNGDGKVGIGDLQLLATDFYGKDSSSTEWAAYRQADLNNDGFIDIEDLCTLAGMILDPGDLQQPLLSAAAEPEFYMTASKSAVTAGEQVEVEIRARNARDWAAYELNLSFDPALWSTGSGSFTSAQEGFSSVVNPELISGGHLRAVFTRIGNAAGASGEIVLGKMIFTAKTTGSGAFILDKLKIGQTGGQWTVYQPGARASVPIVSGGDTTGGNGSHNDTEAVGTGASSDITITGSSLVVNPLFDEHGAASVKIDSSSLRQAIDRSGGSDLSLVVQNGEAVQPKRIEIELPLEQIRGEAGPKVRTVSIRTGIAAIMLKEKLFADGEAAAAASLKLSVARTELADLPAGMKEGVKPDTWIYDFNMMLDGHPVSVLKAGEISMEIPYTLRQGETGNKVVIYRVSANGQPEVVKNARYDQAAGAVQFAPTHSGQYFAAFADSSFQDLHEAEWARAYIEALAARDVVDGMSDGQFDPNRQLTRGQFIAMLVNMFDLADSTAVSSFADTARDAWYYTSVATAQKLGIVDGREDGTFGADERISRQDLAVMLHRASRILGLEGEAAAAAAPFADQADIAEYAAEAVAAMQRQGIINGLEHQIFAPQGLSTRAQAAVVMYRMAFPG